jgi:hypothetical protein
MTPVRRGCQNAEGRYKQDTNGCSERESFSHAPSSGTAAYPALSRRWDCNQEQSQQEGCHKEQRERLGKVEKIPGHAAGPREVVQTAGRSGKILKEPGCEPPEGRPPPANAARGRESYRASGMGQAQPNGAR